MDSNVDIDISAYNSLISNIYDAALDIERWPAYMDNMSDALNANSCMLRVQNIKDNSVDLWINNTVNLEFQLLYQQHYIKMDPLVKGLMNYPLGKMTQVTEFHAYPNIKKTEFFNDYIVPQSIENLSGGFLFNNGQQVVTLGVHRTANMGAYTETEMRLLQMLVPHMQRAVEINRRMFEIKDLSNAIGDTLDHLPTALVLTDANGKALFINQQARILSIDREGLCVRANRLVAASGRDTLKIRNLINHATQTEPKQGGGMLIQSPNNSKSVSVVITPVGKHHEFNLGGDCSSVRAAVFVSSLDQMIDYPQEILRSLFGLTPAEIKLATALTSGEDLNEISDKLRLSKNTLRNQLKSCFHKTGAHRQTELVALLLKGVPILVDKD